MYLLEQLGKLKKFSVQSEHLSPSKFSRQEHIPDTSHSIDRVPFPSQLHAKESYEK